MAIFLGLLLLGGAFFALSVSLGLVQLTDGTIRQRLLGTLDEGARKGAPVGPAVKRLHIEEPESSAKFVVPSRLMRKLERNLLLAGYPSGWTMRNILLIKIIAPPLLFVLVYNYSFAQISLLRTGVGAAVVLVGYFLPDLLLYSRATERQQEMQRQLPDALDKIVISIESGLGFEAALLRASETGRGDLSDELVRTVQDIRVGMGRRDAYEALAQRTSSEDIQRFVRSVIQAAETGVSISSVVRTHAKEMRMKRRLRAEGKAQQVSVKLLFPLLACVFPVLFVVVLAPGIMTAVATFKN